MLSSRFPPLPELTVICGGRWGRKKPLDAMLKIKDCESAKGQYHLLGHSSRSAFGWSVRRASEGEGKSIDIDQSLLKSAGRDRCCVKSSSARWVEKGARAQSEQMVQTGV